MILRGRESLSLDDAERMRVIRNECRSFMTRNQLEISRVEQREWFQSIDRETIKPFLFFVDGDLEPAAYGLARQIDGKWFLSGGLNTKNRGHGLGSQLFAFLISVVGKPCWLEALSTNQFAIHVYKHLGFKEVSQVGTTITMSLGVDDHADAHVPSIQAQPPQPAPPPRLKIGSSTTLPHVRKVMVAVINYDHPQRGMLQAFRGIFGSTNVLDFDYLQMSRSGRTNEQINEDFVRKALEFNPDWIWLQVQDSCILSAETILRVRLHLPNCVVSHWTGDLRASISPYLASFCQATTMTLVSSVGQIESFRAAGAHRVSYLQVAIDLEEDAFGDPTWVPPFGVPDVVFIGGHYPDVFAEGTRERVGAIRKLLAEGINVGVVGTNWPTDIPCLGSCTVKQQYHVWKRAKVALSINHFNTIRQYYSDRQLIAMVSGTPVVCRHVPGLETEFVQGVHCLWYNTEEELVMHVRRLLSDPVLRKLMGSVARSEVLRHHTWFSRIFGVLGDVTEIRSGMVPA